MKFELSSRPSGILFLSAFLVAIAMGELHAKPVRLRNETVEPPAKSRDARQRHDTAAVSGLFLVQFTGPLQTEWREALRQLGVDLIRFVPEDTFVAHFRNALPDQVAALDFVEWAGEFRPEHKLHSAVRGKALGKHVVEAMPVAVLLSSRAAPNEVAEAKRTMAAVRQESKLRFGTVLRGSINQARLEALARSPAVLWIEPARDMKLFDEVSTKIVAGDGGGHFTIPQSLGFDGSGVTVGVADSGLHNGNAATMHPDLFGRVTAFFFYGSLTDAADEHSHGTHVTGIIAGNGAVGETDENGALYGLGVAPGARIVAQRIFDGVGNYEPPPSSEKLTRDATRAGAVIGSNSWGDDTQGRYDLFAAEFDELVRDADALTPGDQPYILEFSAGNAGPGQQTIGTPAVAKNVIATGAAENDRFDFFIYDSGQDTMADFSSRGPCEDGRIKPDLVAPGTWIASLKSASATDEYAWAPISANYMYQGGTSQSGPHVSGAAAVFVQYYRQTVTNATPSPALVKAALINSAVDMLDDFGTEPTPNMDEGWGRLDLTQIIGSTRRLEYVDQTAPLGTGQIHERNVVVASGDEPLKITLAYTDVPGFPGAIGALVNDLDLEVVGPNGAVYRGNQFLDGQSVPNAPASDSINNVEAVHLATPLPGEYTVRVRARSVVEDARVDTGPVDQDFALVISGDLPLPGVGLVFFDRGAYTAPSQIKLKVIDLDMAGSPSVNVLLKSTTEPAGENITLLAAGPLGRFTNTVPTATGAPVADGRLQISHNDTIEARYFDASAGTNRSATARGDLVPPVLTNPTVTNEFGRMVVKWQSDEPANSIVRYNTNSTVLFAATNALLTQTHAVALDNLRVGATYYYLIVSSDEAGNTTTNNNGGALFSFVAIGAKPVLLVDAYAPFPSDPSPVIPLSAYTDALAATGIPFDVWSVSSRGSPNLVDLQPHPVVIWRVNDSLLGSSVMTGPQMQTIENYVNGDGGFLIASMELLSRNGTNAAAMQFRSNVLHVSSFLEDAGVETAYGVDNGTSTEQMELDLNYDQYDNWFLQIIGQTPNVADTLAIHSNATPVFLDLDSDNVCGLRYPRTGMDSTGRVVFLAFPLDSVSETAPAPNNRSSLLLNLINFLAPGVGGRASIALDSSAYTVPSRVTVEMGDSDLAGAGSATVTFYSTTATNGVTVTLQETVRPGLFRGSIQLVPGAAPPASGKLRAKHGDTVWVDYFDASANSITRASAIVDTVPPVISNVAAEPDYEEAVISWVTSKPTDALVQFGESVFLGRTAYNALLRTAHELTLVGLVPDRLYYYQVVSRDAAGNTVVDNNSGNFYTFRTLKPVVPPWSDSLDTGATNWTVYSTDETQSAWTLGVPNNGQETSAHSPPNAWGSNRNGAAIDYSETFLISPAIDLTGGNQATLRFWHSYDFTERSPFDIWEVGQLLIITNNASAPLTLADFWDFSFGWEQEQINLTPYVGRVVYLVWFYQLLSFDSVPRPGWLVDDVSLTMSTVVPGTIVVSNNLWQAHFVLNGPTSRSGKGTGTTYTNLPPGQYVVTFGDVPYYQTPPAQTNTLNALATLMFQGSYTFTDANNNGMSDAWELAYFGSVSPGRTSSTDTDADGLPDFGEFVAGTNPTNAASKFVIARPIIVGNTTLQLPWQSVPGRAYRVEGSADATTWFPISDWIHASGGNASFTTPLPAPGGAYLFRVQVRP